MSTTADATRAVSTCRPTDGTPVTIHASALESTAAAYLQSLKRELDEEGFVPAELVVEADFGADCSLTTQSEADRVRDCLYAAGYLGAGTVRLDIGAVADDRKVRPAVSALRERAEREGLTLAVDGPDTDDL